MYAVAETMVDRPQGKVPRKKHCGGYRMRWRQTYGNMIYRFRLIPSNSTNRKQFRRYSAVPMSSMPLN